MARPKLSQGKKKEARFVTQRNLAWLKKEASARNVRITHEDAPVNPEASFLATFDGAETAVAAVLKLFDERPRE